MCDSMSKGSHHHGYSYSRGWLTPMEVVCLPSRPCLYLAVPSRFRFWRVLACSRLGGVVVEAGSCQARSSGDGITIGEALGARSGPARRRSGVLRAKFTVVPPCDSPMSLVSVPGTIISSSLLFSGVASYGGCLPAVLLLRSVFICSYPSSLGLGVSPSR